MDYGTIYLVGAGPGDPDLLTVKAKQVLENADVILYDSVVSKEIIAINKNAKLIDAGLAGFANIEHQRALAKELVSHANDTNIVVRLKSGDPFIFGNGGETLNFILDSIKLSQKKLRAEIVPGISSSLGSCALLGIPLTHSGVSSSLCLISGHYEENVPKHDYQFLSKAGTLVLYMALHSIKVHLNGLLKAGLNNETPVAIIESGGHLNQRVFTTNLKDLYETIISNKIQEPVVFIIGQAVSYSPFL